MSKLKNSVALLTLIVFTGTTIAPSVYAQDADALRNLVDSAAATDGDTTLPTETLLTAEEIDPLVAPIALYPDALLAQVLVAATYPLQIVKADRILAESDGLSDQDLTNTLSNQAFDPSVLVLVSGFPTVIERMAADLDDTETLGIAMLQQEGDVLEAVQRLRRDARAGGYLTSNEAQIVEEDAGQIYVKPAKSDVVYVPTYDPSVVYTSQAPANPYYVATPQNQSTFSATNLITTGVIAFGAALLVNELFDNDDNNNNNNNNDDWHGYWGRKPISWQNREFYPRPYRYNNGSYQSWSSERNQYWRNEAGQWRRQAIRNERDYQRERQDALGYLGSDPARVRANGSWRDMNNEARRERQAIIARQQNLDAQAEARRREKAAENRRDSRAAAERREQQARRDQNGARAQDAKREQDARRDQQAKREQDAKREQQAKRNQEQDAQRQQQVKREQDTKRQQEAKRDQDAKRQQQAKREQDSKQQQAKREQDAKRQQQAKSEQNGKQQSQAKREQDAKRQQQAKREQDAKRQQDARRQQDAKQSQARGNGSKNQADNDAPRKKNIDCSKPANRERNVCQ